MIEGIDITILSKEDVVAEKKDNRLSALCWNYKCGTSDLAFFNKGFGYFDEIPVPQMIDKSATYWLKDNTITQRGYGFNSHEENPLKTLLPNGHYECIRPVLKLSDEMFGEIVTNGGEHFPKRIEFGHYAQNLASDSEARLMSDLYSRFEENKKKMKSCGVYTYNSTNHLYYGVKLEAHPIYEFLDDKFVRVKYQPNLSRKQRKEIKLKFSDGVFYQAGAYGWFKVTPIEWIVDYENHQLISKNCLLSGIPLNRIASYGGNFEKSYLNYYLHTYMLPEILQFTKYKVKGEYDKNSIESVLGEIKRYKKYYLGRENLQQKVGSIIDTHNSKVKELSKNHFTPELEFQVGFKDIDTLDKELLNDLNGVVDILKADYEKCKPYYDMINILNGVNQKAELYKFIKSIRLVIDNRLLEDEKDKLNEELETIINKHIDISESLIEEAKNGIQGKTMVELETLLRIDLQPFLMKLHNLVETRDVVEEMMNGVKNIINNHYVETKNVRAKYLLDVIKEVADVIRIEGTNSDLDKLKEIVEFKIDYTKDTLSILRELSTVIKRAFDLEFEITERRVANERFNSSIVQVDLNDYLGEEPKL